MHVRNLALSICLSRYLSIFTPAPTVTAPPSTIPSCKLSLKPPVGLTEKSHTPLVTVKVSVIVAPTYVCAPLNPAPICRLVVMWKFGSTCKL